MHDDQPNVTIIPAAPGWYLSVLLRSGDELGRVLINRDCSAIAGCRKRRVRIALDVQAIFFRRRHQPRRPPHAKIRPGRPAPAIGPGTDAVESTRVHTELGLRLPASFA